MKTEDTVIGMKVTPFQKTIFGCLNDSIIWQNATNKNQNYLFVIDFDEKYDAFVLNENDINTGKNGDYFNVEDFEPYDEDINIININNPETIKKYLDNVITNWRERKKDSETSLKEILNTKWSNMVGQYEEDILVASCYIDAFQSVRVSLFGELLD